MYSSYFGFFSLFYEMYHFLTQQQRYTTSDYLNGREKSKIDWYHLTSPYLQPRDYSNDCGIMNIENHIMELYY